MTAQSKSHELQSVDPRDPSAKIADLERQLNGLKVSLQRRPNSMGPEDAGTTALRIRRVLKARRAREQFFEADLFADPAWDILLDSYEAHLLEKRTSVTALCEAAGVPATTGLRWLNKLEQEGLLVRRNDPLDRRRTWMELTPAAAATMRRYLEAISTAALI